jgi:hypothetical protein
MSIDVPVLEVLDLADRLRGAAAHGFEASARMTAARDAGAVTAALDDLVACFTLASRAVATETELLGDTVEATARSWLTLDAALLARRGQVLAR